MRVLIIGGLGYIGSALIEQYKNRKTKNLKVDIVDKRFVPHILKGLGRNFRFVHGDMKDDAVINPLLKEKIDVVYILAAEVEAEKSINKEKYIWENNFEATVKVIGKIPADTRIIYASTGNVFGGVNESKKYKNLTEKDRPMPKYPYAESKRAVEKYLLKTGKNFVICRFGTNYGYAPGIRFNLVTNNFIKKALSGENITIHGKGENYRPTVCVKDAARAILFLSGKKKARGQIFHVVSENFRIKDLASRMQCLNPDTRVEYIAKEVPFSSYHLSSGKIKKLGFKFEWDLKRAMDEMALKFSSIKAS